MFKGFDFGKALAKKVEAHRRLSADQQRKRAPQLAREIDIYARKYLEIVSKPGAANPGLLKNGAEVLVEAAVAVQESQISYITFADLVARSRKVPVVPGLATLVDKLLEVPTQNKDDRIALISWRITTGSMRPERHLQYLSERAQLTGDVADWKDYSWAVAGLAKKGTLSIGDPVAVAALQDLLKNIAKLADRAVPTQLMMIEAHLARKEYRDAEGELLALGEEAATLPEQYIELCDRMCEVRPECAWPLHLTVLVPALGLYGEGKFSWGMLTDKLNRARTHGEELARYLVEHELVVNDEKLAAFAARQVLRQEGVVALPLIEELKAAFAKAQRPIPEAVSEAIAGRGLPADAYVEQPLSEPEPEAETPSAESAATADESAEAATEQAAEEVAESAGAVPELASVEAEVVAPEPVAEEHAAETTESDVAELALETAEADEETPEPAAELAADEVAESESAPPEQEERELSLAAEEAGAAADELEERRDEVQLTESEEAPAEPVYAAEPDAGEEEPAPEPAAAEAADPELMRIAAAVAACSSANRLRKLLAEEVAKGVLARDSVMSLAQMLEREDLPRHLQLEAHVWLAEWLARCDETDAAVQLLATLPETEGQDALDTAHRIRAAFGSASLSADVLAVLIRLEAAGGDYAVAFDDALQLDEELPQRAAALGEIEERIAELAEPSPQLLMLQARAQRVLLNDPEAGFEPATTAELLGGADPELEEAYRAWLHELPDDVVHVRRARQAVYLCANMGHSALLPTAIGELEALLNQAPESMPEEALDWLTVLRPLLDDVNDAEHSALRTVWTRLYLLMLIRAGRRNELPAALQAAVGQVDPDEALALVAELGAEVPVGARVLFECDSLVRRGDWERAVDLALASAGTSTDEGQPSSILPIELFCERLSIDALLTTSERLTRALLERGDEAGELKLIQCLESRLAGANGEAEPVNKLRGYAGELLAELISRRYEPAVRYRLHSSIESGQLVEAAQDLLTLARAGDTEAQSELPDLLDRLLPKGAPPEQLCALAQSAAQFLQATDPQRAFELLARTGLATGRHAWALDEAARLELQPSGAQSIWLEGQLSLLDGRTEHALDCVAQLMEQEASHEALLLAGQVLEHSSTDEGALLCVLRLEAAADTLDVGSMAQHLLSLAQLSQERNSSLKEMLGGSAAELEQALSQRGDQLEALQLRLVLAALAGERQVASAVLQQILAQGQAATDELLAAFERLALEDADLPSSLVVAWSDALFRAGRLADALDRLSGLRTAVGDYPEYITLLKEIREGGGGAGASMQLGEAYLHVNLWQQSAEEYSAALEADPTLAEPILTQLRTHAALDPNPMKYPLHLLGLRAVAGSDRAPDWGWALSALAWLMPRWSAEELYDLSQSLWSNSQRVELSAEQRVDLLLALHRLATKLKKPEQALKYLGTAWEASTEERGGLLSALKEFDRGLLPAASPLHAQLLRWILEGCVQAGDTACVVRSANELAATGTEEREAAIQALLEYQQAAADPTPVLLARLALLDLSSPAGRDEFVRDLLAAADGLSTEQAHAMIRTVLDHVAEYEDSPELTRLLLLLFTQLGDEARAWQLALAYITGSADPAPTALEVLTKLAANEYNVAQQVTLAAVQLVRADFVAALAALKRLDLAGLGVHGAAAAEVGEALLATEVGAEARAWLIDYYRHSGQLELAADHLVWAHATSNPLPAEWLHEQRSGELLFRSAQLLELAGNLEAARRQYDRARLAETRDNYTRAAIRMRLSQLAEQEGNLEQALRLANDALASLPGHKLWLARAVKLERTIKQQQVGELQQQPDSVQRTLQIAAMQRACGEVDLAIAELQAGLNRGQTDPEIFIELAECFHDSGDYNIARRAFSEVLKRLESDGGSIELRLRALYGLALTEEKLKDLPEGIRCLEQILMLRHDYRDSRERLKLLYAAKSMPDPARGSREQILDEILHLLGGQKPGDEKGSKP